MKTVVIGGGHGASASLRAALEISEAVAGVITVADDGGSSGELARDLGVLPMGDIRNCLAALAPDSQAIEVLQYRFTKGSLRGHPLGNLVIAAVAQQTGDFMAGVDYVAQLMGSRGRVVPPTLEPVRLVAEVEGERVDGQVAVATVTGKISRLMLEPAEPKGYPEAVDLIDSADLLVLGPGSLFTSVLPPLLVPDIADALVATRARKLYVCNLVAPPGETADFDAPAHLRALQAHLDDGVVDVILCHEGRAPKSVPPDPRNPQSAGGPAVEVNHSELESLGVEVVTADLIPDSRMPRHDPPRLAAALRSLFPL